MSRNNTVLLANYCMVAQFILFKQKLGICSLQHAFMDTKSGKCHILIYNMGTCDLSRVFVSSCGGGIHLSETLFGLYLESMESK